MNNLYKIIYIVAYLLVYLSCINTALLNIDPNYDITNHIFKNYISKKYFYILVGLLAIYLLLHNYSNHNTNYNINNNNSCKLKYTIKNNDTDGIIWWITNELNNQENYEKSGIIKKGVKGKDITIEFELKNKKNKLLKFREIHDGILSDVKTIFI